MQETWVQYLGQENPLEEEMATHSNSFAWRIPWTEEPGGLQFMGLQRVEHDWAWRVILHCLPVHLWDTWLTFFFPYFGLPGASVRNPTRDKVMRQRSDGQGESDLRASPWYFLSMYPKNQSLPAFVLCFCTLLTYSGKSHLKALVFCIWKCVSIQKPLWWLSSLPAGLIQLHMWLFEASWPQEEQEA